MEFVFLVLLVPVMLVAFLYAQGVRQQRQLQAAKIAEHLGLSVTGMDELTGMFNGVAVTQYSKDLGGSSSTDWWTFTRCQLLEDLPRGMAVANQGMMGHLADMFGAKDIQLGNELDPALRISGERDEDVRELLNDPDVAKYLRSMIHSGGKLTLRNDSFEVRMRGRHLDNAEPRIRQATNLVVALADARRKHWHAVATHHGLELNPDGDRMSGPLLVSYSGGITQVRASFRKFLPTGTQVLHVDRGRGAVKLGDPILDQMVSIETSDPAALAQRLSDDAVRGALLEVVHGFPGSVVSEREIWLTTKHWPGSSLAKAVDAVAELVRGLEG